MPIQRAIVAAACGWLSLASLPAAAQGPTQAPLSLDPIVVTAARMPQPLAQVPLDVRVIERSQIERAGPIGLAELLQRLGGAEISTTGGPGQISGVFLRGSNANHVLVLVDGVRINSATSGTNALEHLPLAQIERIEVLHGPASALYGADAIGGVIQIFTRRDDGLRAELGAGSARTRTASAGFGHQAGDTRFSLQGGWREVHSASATNPGASFSYHPDDDPYRNAHLAGSVSQAWAPGHRTTLRASLGDSRAHFDAGAGSDDVNDHRLRVLALESRHALSGAWTTQLRLARGTDDSRTEGGFPSRFRTDQDQLGWQNDVDLATGQLAAGLEWRRERVDSDTAFTETERTVGSAFGSYAADLGAQQLQLALRHDRYSGMGGHSTANAGWQWQAAPGWTLTAAAGTAFKAPSFNDLYYPAAFGFEGNPDLNPERSRSFELGTRYARGGLALRATAFDNRIRDLIVITDDFSTVENVARARIRGLTLGATHAAGPWTVRADATLQKPENADTGNRLVRRARRFGSAGLDFAAGAWRAGVEVVASGERYDDAANSDAARLAGYALLNLHAAWTLRPGWTLAARLDNAADRAYTLVRGYDPEGRRVFVSLAYDGR